MKVAEIFESLEGEGPWAGYPALFIRFAGCSLNCTWCDTKYAQAKEGGMDMTVDEVLARIQAYKGYRVVLTGGEPLEAINPEFVREIRAMGFVVEIETNGAMPIDDYLMKGVEIIMDWKLPSSGMAPRMCRGNLWLLRTCDTLNLVIADELDWAEALKLPDVRAKVQVTPCAGRMDPATLAKLLMESGRFGKLSLQLHKLIWPDADRGV